MQGEGEAPKDQVLPGENRLIGYQQLLGILSFVPIDVISCLHSESLEGLSNNGRSHL